MASTIAAKDDGTKNKRQRVNQTFLQRITLAPNPQTGLIDHQDFQKTFEQYQIAYIPNVNKLCKMKDGVFSIRDLSSVFTSLELRDQETWTEETWQDDAKADNDGDGDGDGDGDDGGKRVPGRFLNQDLKETQRGYCSFIVQHDKKQMERLLNQLPITDLPIASSAEIDNDEADEKSEILAMEHGPGLWIFFGCNDGGDGDLEGRGEHTDSIQHDGTWHYQLSGVKLWHVRPTTELLHLLDLEDDDPMIQTWKQEEIDDKERDHCTLDMTCSMGDVLLINTRLWWHSTILPGQPVASSIGSDMNEGKHYVPSISYARDIYLGRRSMDGEQQTTLTNLDGLYAANDIEAGTVVFRESDMPDCELHRTNENPNCEIVELEDGEGGIVSCRSIKAGEFFCIMESDDDSDDEGEFETDDEEEEEE
jgi:U3 small nucleolar RNA-associated protein 6